MLAIAVRRVVEDAEEGLLLAAGVHQGGHALLSELLPRRLREPVVDPLHQLQAQLPHLLKHLPGSATHGVRVAAVGEVEVVVVLDVPHLGVGRRLGQVHREVTVEPRLVPEEVGDLGPAGLLAGLLVRLAPCLARLHSLAALGVQAQHEGLPLVIHVVDLSALDPVVDEHREPGLLQGAVELLLGVRLRHVHSGDGHLLAHLDAYRLLAARGGNRLLGLHGGVCSGGHRAGGTR
mmetsp:Transcript_66400/g.197600  ORF Transcript_66400/g.197600 Transcript_66400/m.197600 type:complete len:234 (+) Transcript_66400:433-1134(+)